MIESFSVDGFKNLRAKDLRDHLREVLPALRDLLVYDGEGQRWVKLMVRPDGLPPPLPRRLPHATDAVRVEQRLVRHQRDVQPQRLGDQHPVERILVVLRQVARALAVGDRDVQGLEAVRVQDRHQVVGRHLDARQLAHAALGRDFPGRRRADEDFRARVADGRLRRPRQAR